MRPQFCNGFAIFGDDNGFASACNQVHQAETFGFEFGRLNCSHYESRRDTHNHYYDYGHLNGQLSFCRHLEMDDDTLG